MLDRVGRAAGEALAAGDVVEQPGVLRLGVEQRATAVGRLGVLAGLIEGPPSSSKAARPCTTRYSSSLASGSASSCSLMIRSPASRPVQALTPKAVMPT
jgi:hypothetical protein